MDEKINISILMDPSCEEPEVIIKTSKETHLTEKLVYALEQCIKEEYPQLSVFDEDRIFLVNQWDVIRVYTENRRVRVCTVTGTYETKLTLKELEDLLKKDCFIRISRFEIVNLKKITSFDLSISGTIRVKFDDGTETWVARRYVRDISERLSLRKGGGRHE